MLCLPVLALRQLHRFNKVDSKVLVQPQRLTVLQVQDAQDETLVSITGHIVSTQGDENYLFKDETGEIQVEIDNHLFQGQAVTPETLITIIGEVDKEWKQISIDADSLLIK